MLNQMIISQLAHNLSQMFAQITYMYVNVQPTNLQFTPTNKPKNKHTIDTIAPSVCSVCTCIRNNNNAHTRQYHYLINWNTITPLILPITNTLHIAIMTTQRLWFFFFCMIASRTRK